MALSARFAHVASAAAAHHPAAKSVSLLLPPVEDQAKDMTEALLSAVRLESGCATHGCSNSNDGGDKVDPAIAFLTLGEFHARIGAHAEAANFLSHVVNSSGSDRAMMMATKAKSIMDYCNDKLEKGNGI